MSKKLKEIRILDEVVLVTESQLLSLYHQDEETRLLALHNQQEQEQAIQNYLNHQNIQNGNY
tara:strand:+ start:2843 stop:3028 length:186 start_codon:yes stop_codon:yes gene_type:complete